MSHRAGGVPAIATTISPNTITTSGSQTFVIEGKNFATDLEVQVDPAFGTLTSQPVISWPTTSTSRVTFNVDVSSMPGTPTARNILLSQAGISAGQAISGVNVTHGFSIEGTINPGDGYWTAEDLVPLYTDGQLVDSWPCNTGGLLPIGYQGYTGTVIMRHTGSTVNGSPALNGKPCVEFDGAMDYLNAEPSEWHGTGSNGFTVAACWQYPDETGANSNTAHFRITTLAGCGYKYFKDLYHPGKFKIYGSIAGASSYISLPDDNTPHQWFSSGMGTGSYTDYYIKVYDGTGATPVYSHATASNPPVLGSDAGLFGRRLGTYSGASAGVFLSEIILYNRILTDQERSDIASYWIQKYGA